MASLLQISPCRLWHIPAYTRQRLSPFATRVSRDASLEAVASRWRPSLAKLNAQKWNSNEPKERNYTVKEKNKCKHMQRKKTKKQNPTLRPTWGLVSFLMPSGVHESGPFKVDTFGWKPRIRLSRDEGCGPFNLRRGKTRKEKDSLSSRHWK